MKKIITIRVKDKLAPVYGEEIDENIFYVNLNTLDNIELYSYTGFKQSSFLIDGLTGMVICQASGKKTIVEYYNQIYKDKLNEFKRNRCNEYQKYIAEYTSMLIDFTNEFANLDESTQIL